MTRDYRKGSPPPRRRKQPRGTCAFWFLAGGLVGAFGVGVAWMLNDQAALEQPDLAEAPAAEEPRPKPVFDFYERLSGEVLEIPDEREPEPVPLPPPGQQPFAAPPAEVAKATPPSAPAPTPEPTPQTASGGSAYLLQVGSFRRASDAEQLKAQLAMQGIQTSIQTVTIDSGETYHRVRTGAYAKSDANAVRAQLRNNGHKPLMMRAQ
jgi:cell division protein FtsN